MLGHITSYLNEIYDSEAETLPETLEDVDIHWHPDILSGEGIANLGPEVHAVQVRAEIRYLPTGQ